MEDNVEYMENQNRCNNAKILGMEEGLKQEKTWDDNEELVQNLIKDKLGSSKCFEIERCRRAGYPGKKQSSHDRSHLNQFGRSDEPCPIVAKFLCVKGKEVLKLARQTKPEGVRFLQDLSRRTLLKERNEFQSSLKQENEAKLLILSWTNWL